VFNQYLALESMLNKTVGLYTRYSARFKVGFPFQGDNKNSPHWYSVHDFLVTYNSYSEQIQLEKVQYQTITKSHKFQSKFYNNQYAKNGGLMPKTCHANDRIIPKISDDGTINGSFLMMNTFYTETRVLDIPFDI